MTTVNTTRMFWIICFLIITTVAGGAVVYKQHTDRERRRHNLRTVATTVNAIATDETARKAAVLERIRKVGIYACDASNLHLR